MTDTEKNTGHWRKAATYNHRKTRERGRQHMQKSLKESIAKHSYKIIARSSLE